MSWRDLIPHRHPVQRSVSKPPPLRLAGTQSSDRLVVKVNTGSSASLTSMQSPAEWARLKPGKRGSWDLPQLPAQFGLVSYELPERSYEFLEIVRVVPDGRGVVTTSEAFLRLLGPRWASQPHALTFGEVHRRHIWSFFPPNFPRVRIIFPGTIWSDPWGTWWSPCVDLTADASRFDFACLGNAEDNESGAWPAFEYAAIVASP